MAQRIHHLDHPALIVSSKAFPNAESIDVSLMLPPNLRIQSYTVRTEGMELAKPIDKNATEKVDIFLSQKADKGHIQILFKFDDGSEFTSNFYGVRGKKGVYLNTSSYHGADLTRLDNELTSKQRMVEDLKRLGIEDKPQAITRSSKISTAPTTQLDTLKLHFTWTDINGNAHPLQACKVSVASTKSVIIKTGYLNNDGVFEVAVPHNSDSYNAFLYAETSLCTVSQAINGHSYACAWGLSRSANQYCKCDDQAGRDEWNIVMHALRITQALYYGYSYAREMSDNEFNQKIPVVFPNEYDVSSQTSYYAPWNKSLNIYKDAYLSWDILLHEFGHLIQNRYNFEDGPGGNHTITDDLISYKNNKSQGIRMAWSEGWPTTFAILVSQYYKLSGYPYVNDSKYDANNHNYDAPLTFWNRSLENQDSSPKGEGCELTVSRILYDMVDTETESGIDRMQMAHKAFWKYSTTSKATSLSEFVKKVYSGGEYYNQFSDILASHYVSGKIHGVSGRNMFISVGGNPDCSMSYQNKVVVDFCSGSFRTFVTSFEKTGFTPNKQTNQITLSIPVIKEIYEDPGPNMICRLQTWQTSNPVTGPFYTSWLTLQKPKHINNAFLLASSVFSFIGKKTSSSTTIDGNKFTLSASNVQYSSPYIVMNKDGKTGSGTILIQSNKPIYSFKYGLFIKGPRSIVGSTIKVVVKGISEQGRTLNLSTRNIITASTGYRSSELTKSFGTIRMKSGGGLKTISINVSATIADGLDVRALLGNIVINTGTNQEDFC